MSQITQHGEAELDSWIKVQRVSGVVEHFHVVDGENIPMTAEAYADAMKEG